MYTGGQGNAQGWTAMEKHSWGDGETHKGGEADKRTWLMGEGGRNAKFAGQTNSHKQSS